MRAYTLLMCLLIFCCSISAMDLNGQCHRINGIDYKLVPEMEYYVYEGDRYAVYETSFLYDPNALTESDLATVYRSNQADVTIDMIDNSDNFEDTWLCKVKVHYNQDVLTRKFTAKLNCQVYSQIHFGPHACMTQDTNDNVPVRPFTTKVFAYTVDSTRVWMAGSLYGDKPNIEVIDGDRVYFYERRVHSTPMMHVHGEQWDWEPNQAGNEKEYYFLISNKALPDFSVNLFPYGYKAALCITDDADQENTLRTGSVFFGATDSNSDFYMTKGLVAHDIPVTKTVFAKNWSTMREMWNDIYSYGSTIAYHTYEGSADDMDSLACWLNRLNDIYDARLWIDHSVFNNPEDIANEGWNPDSPYYVLDMLRENNVRYAWIGFNRINNFNARQDYWQLPHTVPAFPGAKGIYFFERLYLGQKGYTFLKDCTWGAGS